MALQTFTAGQVLTAAQMTALQTNDFNQTVSTKTANYTFVVGDRGTRVVGNGTSITFTVDNTIFSAGDTIKIHNINSTALTIAAGTGVTINAAAGLTMLQYQEATLFATSASSFILFESTAATTTQGLTLINTTSFSGVASQSINDVFSTTYDHYKIFINITAATVAETARIRLRVGGTDNSASNYEMGAIYVGAYDSVGLGSDNSVLQTAFFTNAINTTYGGSAEVSIFNPFKTNYTHFVSNSVGSAAIIGNCGLTVTTSYTGFTYIAGAGTVTGSISVFGVNK